MNAIEDIRWEQRFTNFTKALNKLSEAIDYVQKKAGILNINSETTVLDEIVKEGLIQRFEYTYEMAWNVMKDYAKFQGNLNIGGSRDAIRYAFSANLIDDGEMWMSMIRSRIRTAHTYNEETANEIYTKIIDEYYFAFLKFHRVMESKRENQKSLLDRE